jgi:hypothetical protein
VINSEAGKKAFRQAAPDQSLPRSQSKIDKTANYFTETQFIKGINICIYLLIEAHLYHNYN